MTSEEQVDPAAFGTQSISPSQSLRVRSAVLLDSRNSTCLSPTDVDTAVLICIIGPASMQRGSYTHYTHRIDTAY